MITDEEAKEYFSANLQRRLVVYRMSMDDLADRIGEPTSRLRAFARGTRLPSSVVLHRIAEAFDTSMDRLFSKPRQPVQS